MKDLSSEKKNICFFHKIVEWCGPYPCGNHVCLRQWILYPWTDLLKTEFQWHKNEGLDPSAPNMATVVNILEAAHLERRKIFLWPSLTLSWKNAVHWVDYCKQSCTSHTPRWAASIILMINVKKIINLQELEMHLVAFWKQSYRSAKYHHHQINK